METQIILIFSFETLPLKIQQNLKRPGLHFPFFSAGKAIVSSFVSHQGLLISSCETIWRKSIAGGKKINIR